MSRRQKSARQLLYNTPHPTPEEKIARVLGGRGKHLYEIQLIDGTSTLATLPPRFRNVVWVKRGKRRNIPSSVCFPILVIAIISVHSGGYVIVLPVEGENKIGAEIVHVLLNEHIKQLRAEGIW